MKREVLLRYLCSQGCELIREGGRHSWWHNPALNKRSAIPRHTEINDILVKKICKDLGILPNEITPDKVNVSGSYSAGPFILRL